MSITIGIDIGSRTTKLVVCECGEIVNWKVDPTSHDPLAVARKMLNGLDPTRLVATGYGRHLIARYFACHTISEIKAVSLGARKLFPDCGAILDIGGQDTKTVALNTKGGIAKFEMNDKCAAGTGRFLEMSAAALALTIDELSDAAGNTDQAQTVSSMCSVFAESEIVSMVARGISRDAIALGIHQAVVKRAISMLMRVSADGPVVFAGGVAKNKSMCRLLEKSLGSNLWVAKNPQIISALGAAVANSSTPSKNL